jgi:hypothetical protein
MKLSEAIRAGAKMRPQGDGFFFTEGDDGIASCAIGAACEAVGLEAAYANGSRYDFAWKTFPILLSEVDYPKGFSYGGRSSDEMTAVIYTLNDSLKWSREAIAEWVETIENKLEGDKQGDTGGLNQAPPACAVGDAVELYPVEVK